NKRWTVDPQGIAWESFHSLDTIPVFGEDQAPADSPTNAAQACCTTPVEAVLIADLHHSRRG
ncbi:MAG: hypothetical protein ABWY12_09555, partial [Burkholderiales bacterium]